MSAHRLGMSHSVLVLRSPSFVGNTQTDELANFKNQELVTLWVTSPRRMSLSDTEGNLAGLLSQRLTD